MPKSLQGNIYQVILAGRGDTWETAYEREIQASLTVYEAKHGWAATHVQLPSCIDPTALNLNGLQVTKEHIGRGSLALWGAEETEPDPPPENGKEGVYKCRRCKAEPPPGFIGDSCWHCGYEGREDER